MNEIFKKFLNKKELKKDVDSTISDAYSVVHVANFLLIAILALKIISPIILLISRICPFSVVVMLLCISVTSFLLISEMFGIDSKDDIDEEKYNSSDSEL